MSLIRPNLQKRSSTCLTRTSMGRFLTVSDSVTSINMIFDDTFISVICTLSLHEYDYMYSLVVSIQVDSGLCLHELCSDCFYNIDSFDLNARGVLE